MKLSVTIEPDTNGYTGRECPNCERYFKIRFGTGLPDATDCHCPYCNHKGSHNEFWTKEQLNYARSVGLNRISRELLGRLKRLERRPDPRALLSIGITVKGNATPIAYYSEKELEERVTCTSCTLAYAIYGTFGFCPDCGVHNSLQILNANFDLILKTLDLAGVADGQIARKLVENALEDAVSCFDGFGREHCSDQPYRVSFQNIDNARTKLKEERGPDIAAPLDDEQWRFVCEQSEKPSSRSIT